LGSHCLPGHIELQLLLLKVLRKWLANYLVENPSEEL
jgi:hypothetical protein